MPIPWAACALPANRPMVMNTHSNANPNRITSPKAASPSIGEPCRRNPTAKAIAAVTAVLHVKIAVSASTLAVSAELRGIGNDRSRSMKPCSRSSAIAAALPIPTNSTPVAMNPGTR